MDHINNYRDLQQEENEILREIKLNKMAIEADIESYLKPKNLFSFFESKIEKKVRQDFPGEFELQKYLISLSLDFLYEKLSEKFTENYQNKDSAIDWRIMAKALVDRFYINNKPLITGIVSDFIDKNIEKLKELTNK